MQLVNASYSIVKRATVLTFALVCGVYAEVEVPDAIASRDDVTDHVRRTIRRNLKRAAAPYAMKVGADLAADWLNIQRVRAQSASTNPDAAELEGHLRSLTYHPPKETPPCSSN